MSIHQFALGQGVRLMARDGAAADKEARFKVTGLLPSDGARCRYCIEHEDLKFSRLAWERDLIGVIRPGWRVERFSNSP